MTSGVSPRTSNVDLYPLPQSVLPPIQKEIHLLDDPLIADKSMDALNEVTATLMSNLKSGEVTTFLKTGGWDFPFFMWAMTQNRQMLEDYTFYSYPEKNLSNLQEHFKHYPKSVVFINSPLDRYVEIPKESYVVQYSAKNKEPVVTLPSLDEEIAVGALNSWIASQQFAVGFEGDTVRSLCKLAKNKKTKSAFSWIKAIGDSGSITPFNISPSKANPDNFLISSKDKTDESLLHKVTERLDNNGLEVRIRLEPSVPSAPSPTKSPKLPLLFTECTKKNCSEVRLGQIRQIKEALSGRETRHAVVIGASNRELEAMLTSTEFKEPVMKFDMSLVPPDKASSFEVFEYLIASPETLLYIPRLGKWSEDITQFFKIFRQNPVVLQITHEELKQIDQNSEFFERFKKVLLTPLNRTQCLQEINSWAENEKVKIPAKTLEIALELAFLLHDESGSEFMFTVDLLERALFTCSVEPKDLWDVFIPMHRQIEKELEGRSEGRPYSSGDKKCLSLVRIAMALKKKFGIDLPAPKVNVSEPPPFLVDLNEKVRGLAQFVVPLQSRLDDLEDALKGTYKNALIVGDSGVGKTKLVEHAAWMSAHKKFEPTHPLFGRTIYVLKKDAFMHKTKFLGKLEEKVSELFDFIARSNSVLFIDEIHLVLGIGVTRGNEMGNIAQHMKTHLEESDVSVIGATTTDEYHKWVEDDHAFVRRFNLLNCENPTDEEALQIFNFYISGLKELHPTLVLTDHNIQTVLKIVKMTKEKISIVHRGKALLEAIAKAAKRAGQDEVNDYFIGVVAKKLIF